MSMSFAQTYILASKVRSKLTHDAGASNVSLRRLVVQANMLDTLMDSIAEQQSAKHHAPVIEPVAEDRTEVTTYEVESDDDDDDDDIYYDSSEYDSESDDDWDDSCAPSELASLAKSVFDYQYPVVVDHEIDVNDDDADDELPALEQCHSSSDSEDELAEVVAPSPVMLHDNAAAIARKPSVAAAASHPLHHRNHAIHSITSVF
ncbi:hypothetical protein DIURU_005317 [Diutina rugosa]|uniref:Uncharacterized protein n=1 Tax=Diutina rugosa TaxID=5481 RepID=A0A642UDZ8_DIURU|nr:uncharacterized protein DIURU_005317 [Diutina rugosa]KAA8897340.1 hypothetical protein DIURU_005317 [Diutina rugosa]